MKRILLISGHGQGDPGAVGNGLQEQNVTRELVNILATCFSNADASISIYDQSKNAYKQLKAGATINFKDYDYVLEVHANANAKTTAQGTGFYVHTTEKGISVEEKVMNNLVKLGLKKWGLFRRSDLLVQNRCKEAGVSHGLIETFFISNAEDVAFYQAHKKEIAQAIADGIIDGFGIRKIDTDYTNWIGTVAGTDLLNVRTGPGMAYELAPVKTVSEHVNVEVFEEREEALGKVWYHVKTGTKILGWVYSGYIKRV